MPNALGVGQLSPPDNEGMDLHPSDLAFRMKRAFRQARERSGFSERKAAAALGVSEDTLDRWEKPSGEGPPWARYVAAAELFDAPEMVELLIARPGWRVFRSDDALVAERDDLARRLSTVASVATLRPAAA